MRTRAQAVRFVKAAGGREQRFTAAGTSADDITMASILRNIHFDRQTIARLNNAFMVVLFGSGLFACMIGASVYDVGRLFSAW